MKTRKPRVPKVKPGQLRATWGKTAPDDWPDVVYVWGGSGASRPDGRILSRAFEEVEIFEGRTLRKELEARGYDITTLEFSIMKKETPSGSEQT